MSTPPEISDPEMFFRPSTTDDFSAKMDKLFADDEKREQSEKITEKPEKPAIFHKGSAFYNSKSVGFVLSAKKSEKMKLVIYDKDKTVISIIDIDDVDFEFSEKDMTVSIGKSQNKSENEGSKLVFIDRNGFQSFSLNVLIRSHIHKAFIISRGSAPFDVSSETSILYDRSIHRTDKDHSLSLPDVTRSVKTRLSAEKLESHWVYRWLQGLGKGAVIMVKVENEETVHEIQILKTKRTSPDPSLPPEGFEKEADDENEVTEVAPTPTPRSFPTESLSQKQDKCDVDSTECASQETVKISENPGLSNLPEDSAPDVLNIAGKSDFHERANAPTEKSVLTVGNVECADLRDTLHRIVGIELDRIEMRLNAKFEELKKEITTRLDRQTSILEQIVAESRKT